jgi:hypothetical protein
MAANPAETLSRRKTEIAQLRSFADLAEVAKERRTLERNSTERALSSEQSPGGGLT